MKMRVLQESVKHVGLALVGLVSTTCVWAQVDSPDQEVQLQENSYQSKKAPSLKYISGCKYLLHEDYEHLLPFDTGLQIVLGFIELDGSRLLLRKGYGWDGASGPVLDTKTVMRATAVHDALYRLIRYELLSEFEFKDRCDLEFVRILEEDGMPKFSRYWIQKGVKQFGLKGVREFGIKKVRSTVDKSGGKDVFTNLSSSSNSSEKETRFIPSTL